MTLTTRDLSIAAKARELCRIARLFDRGLIAEREAVRLVVLRCGLRAAVAREALHALLPLGGAA